MRQMRVQHPAVHATVQTLPRQQSFEIEWLKMNYTGLVVVLGLCAFTQGKKKQKTLIESIRFLIKFLSNGGI